MRLAPVVRPVRSTTNPADAPVITSIPAVVNATVGTAPAAANPSATPVWVAAVTLNVSAPPPEVKLSPPSPSVTVSIAEPPVKVSTEAVVELLA